MGRQDQGLEIGRRFQVVPRVLIFLRNGNDVLLLRGAAGKRIWANRYNGVGGHVEDGEDVLSAARREVEEETGQPSPELHLKAVVTISTGESRVGILMFCFVGWTDDRQTVSSREGELHWLPAAALPDEELVEDLVWLLPRVLARPAAAAPLYLHYSYDADDRLVIGPGDEPAHRAG
jgi:8-oxo-dGTP diphosphatase